MRVATKVRVGARGVVGAAVGQGERVPMHGGRNKGLWSSVGKVAVPFLMAGTKMLHLKLRRDTCLVSLHQPLDAAVFHVFACH